MQDYTVVAIDLAKTKFHIAALDESHKVVFKKALSRKEFIEKLAEMFAPSQTFAFEACGGAHNIGQILVEAGHKVIALKPRDVKAYAKSRQKNDTNDAIAICKAALDPDLKHVVLKSKEQQVVAYLHKSRENVIQQRIQRSNSLLTSLQEFGFVIICAKTKFAKHCKDYVLEGYSKGFICDIVKEEMLNDCQEIEELLKREKELDDLIAFKNKGCEKAKILSEISGIGPINASILSIKPMESYETAKDFAASLGLVPKQNTTGGNVKLGGITKQGDSYARKMLIQAGRSVVMRAYKENPPKGSLYDLVARLREKGKKFNVIAVAVANKLARIAYACVTKKVRYQAIKNCLN
jgi:transposase